MDKYIDDFCEKHFLDFEKQGSKNQTDRFFDNSPVLPSHFPLLGFSVAVVLLGIAYFYQDILNVKNGLAQNIGIGLLTSSMVTLYFDKREKAIRYYRNVVRIIDCRIQAVDEAKREANEHVINVSTAEGFQLLQYTAGPCKRMNLQIEERRAKR